jgi:hypothetical protein
MTFVLQIFESNVPIFLKQIKTLTPGWKKLKQVDCSIIHGDRVIQLNGNRLFFIVTCDNFQFHNR